MLEFPHFIAPPHSCSNFRPHHFRFVSSATWQLNCEIAQADDTTNWRTMHTPVSARTPNAKKEQKQLMAEVSGE
jgi:hypothetical protein